MVEDAGALLDRFEESFTAIKLLTERRFIQPALVVQYSAMDAAAWLDVQAAGDVTRKDFVTWTERYFLPDSGLKCTGLELYGARCGLLHSHTAFSKLSREGGIRTIGYAWGTGKAEDLNEAAVHLNRPDVVGVHMDDLLKALRAAIQSFLSEVAVDGKRWQNVAMRSKKLFDVVPAPAMSSALRTFRQRDA
jgi:hypothetical protein